MKNSLLLLISFGFFSAHAQTMQGTIKAGSAAMTIDVYMKASASFSQKDEAMTFTLAVPATVSPAPSLGSSGVQANSTGAVSGITGLVPNFDVDNLGATSREVVVSTQTVAGTSYYIYTFIFSGTAAAAHSWTANVEQKIFSVRFTGCTTNCSPASYLMVSLANGGSGGISFWYVQPNTLGDITNYPSPFYASQHTFTLVNGGGNSSGNALSYITLATPFNYYPKTTATDLSQLSNWTSDPAGGAGTTPFPNPADFVSTNQMFNINSNVTTPTALSSWSLSGGSNMTITNNNGLTMAAGARLTIGTGSTANFNSKPVILKSSALGTAAIGTTTGTISNATNVTAERYISNKRAWRLLGIPFSTSAQTIKAAWQEGATTSAQNPNPPYGTHITTFAADPNVANFDAAKPFSSIRTYSLDLFTSDVAHTPNTTTTITNNQAYFLFVRGDRTIDLTNTAAHSAATLRITGTPNSGNVTKGVTGTTFSLIPNPYPSAVSFDDIKAIAANSSITTFYIWDATLAGTDGVGQYRTISISGAGPSFTYTATPGGIDPNWKFIESGAAFLVPGTRTVDFTEAVKNAGAPTTSVFRIATTSETQIAINLNVFNPDNTTSLADGIREIFDNSYSAAVDKNDAKKPEGFNLNLGIALAGDVLSVEKRPLPQASDVINFKLWNTAPGNYQFEIQPANFPSDAQFAYLHDNYFNIYTPVSLTSDTKVNFTIGTDIGSASLTRFSLVFSQKPIISSSDIVVYPNPIQDGNIKLLMKNLPSGTYSVRILNSLGQTVLSKQINHQQLTNIETIQVSRIKGGYTLEVIKPDNSKQTNKIILN